jgi:predicted DNA-binding transcriptional regulator YafY
MARPDTKSQWPFRWDLLLRYRLIEIVALWEGRLTTNALMTAFGIGRQQASKDINSYLREIGPENLQYDKQLKGYKPTTNYKPILTRGTVDEYLHLLNSRRDLVSHFSYLNIQQANTEVISPPNRAVKAHFTRPVIQASREQKRLEIVYLSITSNRMERRIITPHTLVYSGYRWHIRAHCEQHDDYRDFVLSRINDIPEPVSSSEEGIEKDNAWNTHITLRIIPDPRLTKFQQGIIERDYGMSNGALEITTRAALAGYYLYYLHIDQINPAKTPEAQQLILENFDECKRWLF